MGVSEKTIYNYFPTKEALVLDNAGESVARMARALRERRPGQSLTNAVVTAAKEDAHFLSRAPDELMEFVGPLAGDAVRGERHDDDRSVGEANRREPGGRGGRRR